MNHLIFNNTAEELKTTIYAQKKSDGTIVPVQVNDDSSILVAGTLTVSAFSSSITVSQITAPVTIGNTSLTVAGTVTVGNAITVSQITAPVTIGNASLTVDGTVTVGNAVTVSQITAPVTIGNTSLTVGGTVTVGNAITVSQITAPVTIGNTSLTVGGTVTVGNAITVSQITAPVTIGNTSLTVGGTVTVGNAITVSQITAPVTIGNTSLTVVTGGNAFTFSTATAATSATPVVLFDNLDISAVKVATFLIYNTGSVAATVSLQISPVNSDTFYIDDSVVGNVAILGNGKAIITVSRFARYARLRCSSLTAGSITAYYNGQA